MSEFWSKEETFWDFVLYGTVVGAGTLFLPIQLDFAGAVALFVTALVAWPLTYWPHKALYRLTLSSRMSASEEIIGAVTYYYGKEIGSPVTILYLITFFVVVLIYVAAITNSLTKQPAKRITIDLQIRMLASPGVVLVLNLTLLMGRQTTIRVMDFLVFPFIAYFLFLSLYLTGNWQPTLLASQMFSGQHTLHQVWISTPVMVFVFSHTPIISTFAIDRRERHGEQAMGKCRKIMEVVHVVTCPNVLFFVFSRSLSIPTDYIEDMKNEGMTILSTLSTVLNASAWLSISRIIVATVTMSRSLLGTYFDVTEGITEVVKTSLHQVGVKKSRTSSHALFIILVSATTLIICCINPNVISMIYAINSPLITMVLFIMPTLSTYSIPALEPYRLAGDLTTLIVGLLCVSMMFSGQNVLFNGSFQ